MSNQRITALIQIMVLILGSLIAIALPVRSYASGQPHDDIGIRKNFLTSLIDFIFPNREERTRGERRSSRAPFDESLPYVLSPRNTALLETDTLPLTWHPVAGAMSYTVKVRGPGIDWDGDVTGTEKTFNDLELLAPDYRYTIVVTTDEGISSSSGEPVGFTLLPETERDRVNAQVEAIKAQQLTPDEEALKIALKYRNFQHSDPDRQSYALNQAAIDVLEGRIQSGTDDSRVYLLQADTYLRIGLPLAARERYEEALTYAQAADQPELQAESYWGLADVAQGQTEYEDILAYLQTAIELYEELGDLEKAKELQIQIEAIESQIP